MTIETFLLRASIIQFLVPLISFIILRVICYVMANSKGISWLEVLSGKELIAWSSVLILLIFEHVNLLLSEYNTFNFLIQNLAPFMYVSVLTLGALMFFWLYWLIKYMKLNVNN